MTANVLILCTHNSARSVLAEGMLSHLAAKARKDVRAFSAGSAPSGRLNPFALEALTQAGADVSSCCSKSWDKFVGDGKPVMLLALPLESMSNADLQQALTAISQS
jgi:arsenate reductase